MSGDALECEGVVVEVRRGDIYEVEVVAGALRRRVLARRSGRLNLNRIKIVAGDLVRLEIGCYDLRRGRITRRL